MLPTKQNTNMAAFVQSATNILQNIGAPNDFLYLKMQKNGDWVFGADADFVEEGSKWAVNPASMATGYACWGDGSLIDEKMALVSSGDQVDYASLPNHGREWNSQTAMQLACLSGTHKDIQCIYSTTSKGGRDAFSDVLKEIVAQMGRDPDNIVPIVELESGHYRHKQYGTIYTPRLRIVDWTSFDAVDTDAAPEKEQGATPEPEPEAKPETTTRRRRRRTA